MVGILSEGHNDLVHAYVGRCAYHHPASVLLIHYVYFIILFYLVNFILADMLTKTSTLNFLLETTHHPTMFWLFQSRFPDISTPGWAATIACVTPPTALSACFKLISRSSESTLKTTADTHRWWHWFLILFLFCSHRLQSCTCISRAVVLFNDSWLGGGFQYIFLSSLLFGGMIHFD